MAGPAGLDPADPGQVPAVELSRAVALLAAMAGPGRVTLLATVLARQERGEETSAGAVAAALDQPVKSVMKEAVRLQECGVLSFDGHAMSADLTVLRDSASALATRLPAARLLSASPQLDRFFRNGRLVALPESPAALAGLARMIVRLLPADRTLSEADVNSLLTQVGDDPASLRRLLADQGLVTRKGSGDYRRVS